MTIVLAQSIQKVAQVVFSNLNYWGKTEKWDFLNVIYTFVSLSFGSFALITCQNYDAFLQVIAFAVPVFRI